MVALADGEKRPLFEILDALRPVGRAFKPEYELQQAKKAAQRAGGGALGAGVGVHEFLTQAIDRPLIKAFNTIDATVAQPAGRFLQGLIGGAPPPAAPARRAGTQAADIPSLVDVTPARPPAPARTPARPPLLPGQTARTPPAQPSRAAAPTFGIDNVPQGGGFISFDEPLRASTLQQMAPRLREQLEQTGAIRITPEQGRSLASQATVVPSSFFTGGTGRSAAVSPAPQTVGPQRSRLISDRSQDFDTLLKDLVEQATREPGSYGELFRRRGVLDALNQVAGVAQGAGTNLTQDITNLRDVLERRRGTDLEAEARAAERGVTTRGQDLTFEGGLLRSLLGAATEQERTDVLREGQEAQLTGTRERIASAERLARERPILELQTDAEEQLRQQILKNVNPDGTPMTAEDRNAWLAVLAQISSSSPLAQLLAQ